MSVRPIAKANIGDHRMVIADMTLGAARGRFDGRWIHDEPLSTVFAVGIP